MEVKLSEIGPNPHRNTSRLPVNDAAVVELVASISETGLWSNPVVRSDPEGAGYQLAFGHNRLEAIRRLQGAEAEIQVDVRDLGNDQMLRMMLKENAVHRGHSVAVVDHDVHQALVAVARGDIEFAHPIDPSTPDDRRRCIADYIAVEELDHRNVRHEGEFVAGQVAALTGRSAEEVKESLRRQGLMLQGIICPQEVADLGPYKARIAAQETCKLMEDLAQSVWDRELEELGKQKGDLSPAERDDIEKMIAVETREPASDFGVRIFNQAKAPGVTGDSLRESVPEIRAIVLSPPQEPEGEQQTGSDPCTESGTGSSGSVTPSDAMAKLLGKALGRAKKDVLGDHKTPLESVVDKPSERDVNELRTCAESFSSAAKRLSAWARKLNKVIGEREPQESQTDDSGDPSVDQAESDPVEVAAPVAATTPDAADGAPGETEEPVPAGADAN